VAIREAQLQATFLRADAGAAGAGQKLQTEQDQRAQRSVHSRGNNKTSLTRIASGSFRTRLTAVDLFLRRFRNIQPPPSRHVPGGAGIVISRTPLLNVAG
jgi:hypothetical protein